MRRLNFGIALFMVVFLTSVGLGQESMQKPAPAAKPTMKLVVPNDVKYGPPPPNLVSGKPSMETSGTFEVAVLTGEPAKPGPYTFLLHCTDGYKIAPHWHPGAENLVILQGSMAIGMGSKWDANALKALPTFSFASIPPGMRHFAQCNGDTVMEIHGNGPFKVNFVSDAPAMPTRKAPERKGAGK